MENTVNISFPSEEMAQGFVAWLAGFGQDDFRMSLGCFGGIPLENLPEFHFSSGLDIEVKQPE